MRDKFVECPRCKSGLCYTQQVGTEETWMCMGCGFTSTTLMKEGSETEKEVTGKQPQLYLDLKFVDEEKYVWYPAVIAVPDRGMVYLDGTSIDNATWVGIPIRTLTRKERRMKEFKGKEYTLNSAQRKEFGKEGFVEALVELKILGDES